MKYLIEEKACNPDFPDCKGVSPHHLAIVKGYTEIIEFIDCLVESKRGSAAKMFNFTDELKKSHPSGEAEEGGEWIRNTLQNQPENLTVRMLAVQGSLDKLKEIVRTKGVGIVREKGPQGETVLHNATCAGKMNVVMYLVEECQCDVNSIDNDGHSPLHGASQNGYTDIVRFLLKLNDCNPSFKDKHGREPIHYASQNGHLEVVRILLSGGKCSSASKDSSGSTPIHLAAFNGHLGIVRLLADQKNANPSAVDTDGRTPLHCACQEGHEDTIKFLVLTCKCDPMLKDIANGATSLHIAVSSGNLSIVKFLCVIPGVALDVRNKELHCMLQL